MGMQVAALLAFFFFGAFIAVTYAAYAATQSASFFALISALFFVFQAANGTAGNDLPLAFQSTEGYATAMSGIYTMQFAILALILLAFFILAALAIAYTRALILGIARDAAAGERNGIVEMFRAGRAYLRGSIWYTLPFFILMWVMVVTTIPLTITDIHSKLVGVETLEPFRIIQFFVMALFLIWSGFTVFAEASIVRGSRAPNRESALLAFNRWKLALATIGILIIACLVMIGLDVLRTIGVLSTMSIALAWAMTIAFLVLALIWRTWVALFVVALTP